MTNEPTAAKGTRTPASADDTARGPGGEEVLWQGRPSQWTNFPWFLACILVLPIPYVIYRMLVIRCTTYTLTSQRLRIATGILNKNYDDLELYRVKDTSLSQPLLLRMVNLGNIDLITSDATHPRLRLPAIADSLRVHDVIRNEVEAQRKLRGVRELDVN